MVKEKVAGFERPRCH